MENLLHLLTGAVGLVNVLLVVAFLSLLIGALANRQISRRVFWRAVAFLSVLIVLVLAVALSVR